jgi:hypothetical protein
MPPQRLGRLGTGALPLSAALIHSAVQPVPCVAHGRVSLGQEFCQQRCSCLEGGQLAGGGILLGFAAAHRRSQFTTEFLELSTAVRELGSQLITISLGLLSSFTGLPDRRWDVVVGQPHDPIERAVQPLITELSLQPQRCPLPRLGFVFSRRFLVIHLGRHC